MQSEATELVRAIIHCTQRLQARGQKMGVVNSRGGVWGLMKSLQQRGPQTIVGLARSRPVSRQHIRQLAMSLIEKGWIEATPNPNHKRSYLLQLTAKGKKTLERMDQEIAVEVSARLDDIPLDHLEITIRTLKQLSNSLHVGS